MQDKSASAKHTGPDGQLQLKNIDRELLFGLIGAGTTGAFDMCEKILSAAGCRIFRGGDHESCNRYLAAVPNSASFNQIALVAHVDTFGKEDGSEGEKELIEENGFIRNIKRTILGADDRAGVYAIMKIMEDPAGSMPVVVLTDGEEIGSLGTKQLIHEGTLRPYIDDIRLFIQIDRRDYIMYNSDTKRYSLPKRRNYVCYTGEPPQFIVDMLRERNYAKKKGSTSDVRHLTEAYGVPHVNISAGYCHEHTPDEVLSLKLLDATIDDLRHFLIPDSFVLPVSQR